MQLSKLLESIHSEYPAQLNLYPERSYLPYVTILYHLLQGSIVAADYQEPLETLLKQLLSVNASLSLEKSFKYTFSGHDKRYFTQYVEILQAISINLPLKKLFLDLLEDNQSLWGEIAKNIQLIKPNSTTIRSMENIHYRGMIQTITSYTSRAQILYTRESIAFVRFIVACKIHIERIRLNIATIPLKKDKTADSMLINVLKNLIDHEPEHLSLQAVSDSKHIASNGNFCKQVEGREIITYFMENTQIKTNKSSKPSYEEIFNSPFLIREIVGSLNKSPNFSGNFTRNTYFTHVPYTSFRPLYLKSLIHALRQKGASIGSIFDPCGGWGGTTLGATISQVSYIIDNDPNPYLTEPKKAMQTFLENNCGPLSPPNYLFFQKDILDFPKTSLNGRRMDMICTSPPFYEYERYDPENIANNQSRSNLTYKKWMEGFVPALIQNSAYHLRESGYFALQISNLATYKTFVVDFLRQILLTNLFNAEFYVAPYSQYTTARGQYNYFYIFLKKSHLFQELTNTIANQDNNTANNEEDAQYNDNPSQVHSQGALNLLFFSTSVQRDKRSYEESVTSNAAYFSANKKPSHT